MIEIGMYPRSPSFAISLAIGLADRARDFVVANLARSCGGFNESGP
jgi:hypothetical protein